MCRFFDRGDSNRMSSTDSFSPTIQGTADLLQKSQKQFRKSDESAFSIAPSKLSSRHSSSTIDTSDHVSIGSFRNIFHRGFSFDKDLLSTRVYKRNQEDSKFQEPRKQEHDCDDHNVTPQKETPQSSVVQQPLVSCYLNVSENRDYGDFIKACIIGDKDEVSRILEDASTCGDSNALILLLDRKCDSVHLCPIHATVVGGFVDVMESLIQYTAHLNHEISPNSGNLWFCTGRKYVMALGTKYRSVSPLHVAAYKGDLSMVQLLLRMGAPVNAQSDHGVQAIHLAARVGSMKVLAALITAGASVSCRDYRRRQPIHYISGTQHRSEVIQYLAENGAEIDAVSHMSQPTALSLACKKNCIGNAKALLSLGAVITRPTLDNAVRNGLPALVKVLLDSVASQEEGQSILAACLRKYLFAFVSRGLSRWDGSWDKKNLQLLLQRTDLLVKNSDGHTVLYSLFHALWVTHEKRLELEELFLKYLPNTKSLERDEIRSIVSNEKKALSANRKRDSTDTSASSDTSQGQIRPYSVRSQTSTSQGSVYSTTSLL